MNFIGSAKIKIPRLWNVYSLSNLTVSPVSTLWADEAGNISWYSFRLTVCSRLFPLRNTTTDWLPYLRSYTYTPLLGEKCFSLPLAMTSFPFLHWSNFAGKRKPHFVVRSGWLRWSNSVRHSASLPENRSEVSRRHWLCRRPLEFQYRNIFAGFPGWSIEMWELVCSGRGFV